MRVSCHPQRTGKKRLRGIVQFTKPFQEVILKEADYIRNIRASESHVTSLLLPSNAHVTLLAVVQCSCEQSTVAPSVYFPL